MPPNARWSPSVGALPVWERSAGRLQHHDDRGGQEVAPHTYERAKPSPIRIAPTSRPRALSAPHGRPLQRCVPSVPGWHEQRTNCRSSPPPATSALSRDVARAARLRSPSQRASMPASGVSNPTRRTVCPRTRIVSASTTSTAPAAIGSDCAGVASTANARAKAMARMFVEHKE